jgi:hypothetical protein
MSKGLKIANHWMIIMIITVILLIPIFINISVVKSISKPTGQPETASQILLPAELTEGTKTIVNDKSNEQSPLVMEPILSNQNTRGSRAVDTEPNNSPATANLVDRSTQTTIQGDINTSSDVDWFKMPLEVYDSGGPLTEIDNFTISLSQLTGDTNYYLGVFVYGAFDMDRNDNIDFDTELIMMNCSIYRIGQSSQNPLSIKSFNTGDYYIKLEINGGDAVYRFQINYQKSTDYVDTNQDIKYPTTLTEGSTNKLQLGYDTFDWFQEYKKPKKDFGEDKEPVGVNFSITVKIDRSLPSDSVQLPNGTIIYFVTILHLLVYHEGEIVGGKPVTYQYRDHIQLSRQSATKLDDDTIYSDVVTLPTHLFEYTFVGFFIESYGVDKTKPGIKFFPLISEIEEYIRESYCTFVIEAKEVSTITRPELSKVSVISLSSNSIFGKTYDTYKYSVWYKQDDNNKPLYARISIFTLKGEFIDDMRKVTPGTGAQGIWADGVKFEYTLSGLELGEGNHHVYQFHFKDKNAHANGTIELGKSWHGPFISNNIGPFVRPSAPDELILYEDDNTTFFELSNIFEDVDLQDELIYTITDPEVKGSERVWDLEISSTIVDIMIVNQSQLRIDPKPNMYGEQKILLNATDKKNFVANYEITIKILPVNDPPQIVRYFNRIILNEDEIHTDINLAEYFIDLLDDEELEYWAENNINIDVLIDENNNVILKPKQNWFGKEYIDFYGSDGNETVSDYLLVIVKSVNDPPQLIFNETLELILWEDEWANLTINAFDIADNESVIIGHNLTEIFPILNIKPENFGYTFDNTTGYLTFKPTNPMVGMYSWNISAKDTEDEVNFTHVTLIINNVNDPPLAEITFPKNGARYLTTDKISFRGTGFDVDSTLKDSQFIWYSDLAGIRTKIGSGRSLPPLLYENGSHLITLSLTDGEYYHNVTITINVYLINQDVDTDGDGIPNYWENLYYFSIHDPNDAKDDPDKDTYSNWEEYMADTDPNDPNSMPEEHIYDESESEEQDITILILIVIIVIIVVSLIIIFMVLRTKKLRKEEDEKKLSTEGIIGMSPKVTGDKSKFEIPKVMCHKCGKPLEILTLNRPLVVTCTDCGSRGVIYK